MSPTLVCAARKQKKPKKQYKKGLKWGQNGSFSPLLRRFHYCFFRFFRFLAKQTKVLSIIQHPPAKTMPKTTSFQVTARVLASRPEF